MANDKAVSEPVCLADRCGKSASRSQGIILLRTHWQKVTDYFMLEKTDRGAGHIIKKQGLPEEREKSNNIHIAR